uniref:PH domain-containing protein n=1 Tax=Haptolina brevifila TaxID=156173 RepID=A0A7S2G347_9EUKA|mmetsp:Transcript_24793/g.49732  ORF Transcript_24793/g.49732 Transcript_24793/m.49732 type:complete len:491 (+) Transcript_24793:740-2212(+)
MHERGHSRRMPFGSRQHSPAAARFTQLPSRSTHPRVAAAAAAAALAPAPANQRELMSRADALRAIELQSERRVPRDVRRGPLKDGTGSWSSGGEEAHSRSEPISRADTLPSQGTRSERASTADGRSAGSVLLSSFSAGSLGVRQPAHTRGGLSWPKATAPARAPGAINGRGEGSGSDSGGGGGSAVVASMYFPSVTSGEPTSAVAGGGGGSSAPVGSSNDAIGRRMEEVYRWMMDEEERVAVCSVPSHAAHGPPLFHLPPHAAHAANSQAYHAPHGPHGSHPHYVEHEDHRLPYPHVAVATLPPHEQGPAGQAELQMPLVGFLWKRGSGWRSFSYQRRFFYLIDHALCYRIKPPLPAPGQPRITPDKGEKCIPLVTVTSVRMHSKLKYEFEVVCTTRSYRLRAPSAQSLALWVTAISSEWMQLQHSSISQQPSAAGNVPAAHGHMRPGSASMQPHQPSQPLPPASSTSLGSSVSVAYPQQGLTGGDRAIM